MTRIYSFSLEREDPLGVLATCAPAARGGEDVRIDRPAVDRFADRWRGRTPPVLEEERLHCTFLPEGRFLNYLLVLEALNFCFWDHPPRWEVACQGQTYDGYWALAAALRRAVREDGLPLWDAHWLAELDAEALRYLLRGAGRPPPLLDDRLAHLREVGKALLERWRGQFANVVRAARGNAMELARLIVAEYPSFRDEAAWGGRRVRFYKRAQICVADLTRLLGGRGLGRLQGLESLTAFADYKLPQVLRGQGILVFSRELEARVRDGEELPAGSREEVEIRAATLWACEWLVRALNRGAAAGSLPHTPMDVDYLLWAAGQDKAGLPPYHRTRTVYY